MARWGEGDPRWHVESRTDGQNVNGWHWEEKDRKEWTRTRLTELFSELMLHEAGEGTADGEPVLLKVERLKDLTGDASITTRKGNKRFAVFDFSISLAWEGTVAGGEAAVGRGGPRGWPGTGRRFAGMVVTLSSGCAETWSRGCCAAMICSSSRPACPFTHENCTHAEPDPQVLAGPTPGVRQYYLHAGGLYDPRYENQAVGSGGALFPHALVRYVGGTHRSSDMWNVSHEYPAHVSRRSKEETMQLLNGLLERHNFTTRRRTLFKSCCASLIVRKEHVRRWDLELY
ncbi:Activator heat shock protein ATPase 2, partial [Tetrabaena socialis]